MQPGPCKQQNHLNFTEMQVDDNPWTKTIFVSFLDVLFCALANIDAKPTRNVRLK